MLKSILRIVMMFFFVQVQASLLEEGEAPSSSLTLRSFVYKTCQECTKFVLPGLVLSLQLNEEIPKFAFFAFVVFAVTGKFLQENTSEE